MTDEEREKLRESLKQWKPKQHVEIRVDRLLGLLEIIENLAAKIRGQAASLE